MTYITMFWIMAAVWLFSIIYPWHRNWPLARLLVHLPWLLVPLWFRYEQLFPPEFNIRVDLLLIFGALGVAFLIYVVRLVLFWYQGVGENTRRVYDE